MRDLRDQRAIANRPSVRVDTTRDRIDERERESRSRFLADGMLRHTLFVRCPRSVMLLRMKPRQVAVTRFELVCPSSEKIDCSALLGLDPEPPRIIAVRVHVEANMAGSSVHVPRPRPRGRSYWLLFDSAFARSSETSFAMPSSSARAFDVSGPRSARRTSDTDRSRISSSSVAATCFALPPAALSIRV